MFDIAFFTDVTLTPNTPSAAIAFICVSFSPTRVELVDVTTSDVRLQQKIVMTTRAGDPATDKRLKFSCQHIIPILTDSGEDTERVEVLIHRFDVEIPPSLSYSDRAAQVILAVNRMNYVVQNAGTLNPDVNNALMYGVFSCN